MIDIETILDHIANSDDLATEVGSLEGILNAVHATMSPEERKRLFSTPEVRAVFEVTESEASSDPQDVGSFVKAAQTHGSYDDPDHQAGDLLDAIRAGWSILDGEGRNSVIESDAAAPFVGLGDTFSP